MAKIKNQQAIYLLLAANAVSGFAQGITMIAIPWFFTNELNLPSLFGNIYFAISVISLFWGLYAGTLVDRFNRRNVFLTISIVGFFVMGGISSSGFYLGELPAALVALAFAATFMIYNIHFPNAFAFVQELTDPKDYSRVVSYVEVQVQFTTALAGAFAAVLLKGSEDGIISIVGIPVETGMRFAAWQMHEIFLLDAITYFTAIIIITRIKFESVAHRTKEVASVYKRLKTGFDYLRQHSLIFIFGTASFFIFVTILVLTFYLNPIYIKNHLNESADVYAGYEIYFALGSIVAGMGVRKIFSGTNTVKAVIIMSLVVTALYFLCMFNSSVAIFYIIALLQGFCNAGTRVMRITYFFHHIPNQIIGRTGSVFMTVSVLLRLFFIFLLSRTFFVTGDHVIYSFGILGLFVFCAAIILGINYKRLLRLPAGAAEVGR